MIFLSSNAFSVDDQINDVVSALDLTNLDGNTTDATRARCVAFLEEFPEYGRLVWSGSWVDTYASGVDGEYMTWVADWIEGNTTVYWRDGEPVLPEPGDPEEEWM